MDDFIQFTVKGIFHLFEGTKDSKRSLGNAAYRPNHQFEGQDDFFIGSVEFESGECAPGQTVLAEVHVTCSNQQKCQFQPGCQWLVFEGSQLVGKMSVNSIV